MRNFTKLPKLKKGNKVAIISPSFAAPGKWPHVYQLGLQRLKEIFGLEPVEFPFTSKLGASTHERSQDIIQAFSDNSIEAIISTLGGSDQVTYIKNLPKEIFVNNPKPFFGYSDNTHLINHLWLCGIPAFYGGNLFTEFALNGRMDDFTIKYLKLALFESGEFELENSPEFSDEGLNWNDPTLLNTRRRYQPNDPWNWDGNQSAEGILWGGCLESIDELLRHNIELPTNEEFKDIVLYIESSEEIPSHDYTYRVLRGLGGRGILEKVQGVLIGRPKAWEFDKPNSDAEKIEYKKGQIETIIEIVRKYNADCPIVQNLDFGHTAPQICIPSGKITKIDAENHNIICEF